MMSKQLEDAIQIDEGPIVHGVRSKLMHLPFFKVPQHFFLELSSFLFFNLLSLRYDLVHRLRQALAGFYLLYLNKLHNNHVFQSIFAIDCPPDHLPDFRFLKKRFFEIFFRLKRNEFFLSSLLSSKPLQFKSNVVLNGLERVTANSVVNLRYNRSWQLH